MQFFEELKRRNIFRIIGAYLVMGWLLIESSGTIGPMMGLPADIQLIIFRVMGFAFPFIILLAWLFEVTDDGIKRTKNIASENSRTDKTGKKLEYFIIGTLALVVVFLLMRPPEQIAVEDNAPVVNAASIAVLPFDDLSIAGDQEYFADGLSEEILNVLVGVDGLTVASRTSSFQFKNNDRIGIPEIATKLNVSFVLEGSIRKAGDTIRITGQLIEASTDRHLWSDTFDRELTVTNIFALQDEIATAIVVALSAELDLGVEASTIVVKAATNNLSAYENYINGRETFLDRTNTEQIEKAMDLLEASVTADPNFAEAWQWLGAAYSVYPGWVLADAEIVDEQLYIDKSNAAVEKALALNPKLGFAYGVLGNNYQGAPTLDFEKTVQNLTKGLALEPNNATMHQWLGIAYGSLGFTDLANQHLTKCLEISPNYTNCHGQIVRIKFDLGDIESAQFHIEEALKVLPSSESYGGTGIFFHTVKNLILEGNTLAARIMLKGDIPNIDAFPVEGWIQAILKPDDNHDQLLNDITKWSEATQVRSELIVQIYQQVGVWDRVPIQGKSVVSAGATSFWGPTLVEYRQSENFKASIRNLHINDYWREHGYPPQCRAVGTDDFECDYFEAVGK